MLNLMVVGLFVALMLVVLVMASRRRVLFKMGARNFVRHRTHSALVVAGLLIGTSIIAGAMVTGDSIDNFIVKTTYDSLDLIDVTVKASNDAYFNETIFTEIDGNSELAAHADAVAPAIVEQASVEDLQSGQSESSMLIVGFDSARDGGFGEFSISGGGTTSGGDLASTEVLINTNAAEKLNAQVGDTLALRYLPSGESYGQVSTFTIKQIVLDKGKGNYQMSADVFISLPVVQDMYNVSGRLNLIKISGYGGMRAGVHETDSIMTAVNGTLTASSDPDASRVAPIPIKETSLEQSKQIGEMVTTFITIFGSFSIIAGVILIINIFTMLAEERKSELGMARAVGMTRGDLMQMFMFEGSTYTIAAAAMGTLAGLGIAFALIWGVNNIFSIFEGIKIPFYFETDSLINAFCMGASITLLTIVMASWRVTNINIVRAIRDIEDPVHEKGSKAGVVLGGVIIGVSLLAFALSYDNLVVRYVAPCVALFGIGMALRGFMSAKYSFSTTAIGMIVWTLYAIATFFDETGDGTEYLFITSGVFLVLAAVLLVMFNSSVVVAGVTGTLGRIGTMRPVVKTAVSHPLNKRFRTGMTVSMFTLVIYTIVMVSVFSAIFTMNVDDTVEQQGGGYQIIGSSQVPVQSLDNASVFDPSTMSLTRVWSSTLNESIEKSEAVSVVMPLPEMTIEGKPYPDPSMSFMGMTNLLGVDDHFIQNNGFEFSEFDEANYSTPADVWAAVSTLNGTNVVYGGMSFGGGGGGFGGGEAPASVGLGTVISITTNYGVKNFTVIGILDEMIITGIFTTKENAAAYFGGPHTFVGNVLFLFDVKDGLDVQEVTFNLEKDYRGLGMNTINLRDNVETMLNLINSIFLLFQIFLGLGLVVGIAGLGIIAIRSVVERRREIGIMRAIGFEKRKILASFVTEILFVTTLAVVIGVVIGIGVAYEIFVIMVEGIDVTFKVPWLQLGWLIGITYVASLACTIAPALKASRIPAAEALRGNE
ncbi:MAG: FtsX-like permease family protein [Methanobacteriota archaeon]